MTNEFNEYYIDENELDKKIESGEITPVHVPKFATFSEIQKFQFCTEIIRYKKENKLKQKDIAEIVNVDKSEISKLFSYNLKEFSQERILGFIESLLTEGADIDMERAWDQIKARSRSLERKLARAQSALQA